MLYRRRHLLQLLGGSLTAWGLHQMQRQGRLYDRALAQSTPRKLALLVGINQYPQPIRPLQGCLTDVAMQYHLLVYRYGFHPRDIVVVSDGALRLPGQTVLSPPTRQTILDAFENHLIAQAQPGDVVVFHYSGHGSYVLEEDGVAAFDGVNGTLVPIDGRVRAGDRVDDITGKTLFLLSSALRTENVTLVLDSCHAGGGVRGNVVVRALDNFEARSSDRELAYQAQWMQRLGLTDAMLRERRQAGIAKGVALGSAQVNQLSAEVPLGDFHAGAFTYLLTRYLWQLPTPQPLRDVFVNLARTTRDVASTSGVLQDPVYTTAPGYPGATRPLYLMAPTAPPAEAVVQSVEGNEVRFWLGGLGTTNLDIQQAVFQLIDAAGTVIGEVVQHDRTGLVGRGTLRSAPRQALQRGLLMREQIRQLPTQSVLKVGVDDSLGGDRATAERELATVSRVSVTAVNPATPLDYLLGRWTEAMQIQAQGRDRAIAAPLNSIGLFTPNWVPVAASFGTASEPIASVIARLRPRLKMLLANKMLSRLVNGTASQLQVTMALQQSDPPATLLTLGSRSAIAARDTGAMASPSAQVKAGTHIQVQVTNGEMQDLYVSILTIASTGELAILHPVVWDAPEGASRLMAGQTMRMPDPQRGDRYNFTAIGPAGVFELLVLVSTTPIRDALRSLQTIARSRGTRSGNPLAFATGARSPGESEDAPVNVVDALLGDLDRGSRGIAIVSASPERQQVDVRSLAAFAVVVEVVD